MKNNNYFNNNYGLIIFSILGVLLIPFSLYLFNAKEFLYDFTLMYAPIFMTFTILVIGVIYNLISKLTINKFDLLNRYVQLFFSGLGVIIYLNDIIVPTQAAALNGDVVTIPESVLLSIVELFIAISTVLYLLYIFKKNQDKSKLVSLSKLSIMLVFFISLWSLYIHYFDKVEPKLNNENINSKLKSDAKTSPNVYFLWLDAMQSDYYYKSIVENNKTKKLGGFTMFKHNISNYVYTFPSYHSFLSGLIYKGDNYKEWISDDKIRKAFVEHNYNLTSYGMSLYISKLDNYNLVSEQILKQALNIKHPYISDFISLSIVRLSPNFLANEALEVGKKISFKLNYFFNPKQIRNINTIESGMHQYVAPLTYDKMIEDEQSRKPYGEFVLSQILIPHGPEVMDDNCEYQKPIENLRGKMMQKRFYMQVNCATKLVDRFLDELKKMRRYNNSLIIIMGDHGAGFPHLLEKKYRKLGMRKKINERYSGWNEVALVRRASALLMIKPPGNTSKQRFEVSEKETQHIDILPTIFNALNWDITGDHDGRDLFSKNDKDRNTILTYFHPQVTPDFDDAEVYHVDYDSYFGRKRLKLMGTFNDYFAKKNQPLSEWQPLKEIVELNQTKLNKQKKSNYKAVKKFNQPDSINSRNFDNSILK